MRVSPDRLLLDEMFSPRIAALLGEAGIDCTSVATEPILRTQDDAAVADAALVQRRILVTNNVVDFELIRRRRLALDQPVPGLVYTDDGTFPRTRSWVGQISDALAYAATHHLTSQYGGVLWLSEPPEN